MSKGKNIQAVIIDNDPEFIKLYKNILREFNIENTAYVTDDEKIMSLLDCNSVEVVIMDISKTVLPSIDLFTAIRLLYPELPVIISTDDNSIELAVEYIKRGASDYIIKSIGMGKLKKSISEAVNLNFTQDEIINFRKDISYIKNNKLNLKLKKPEAFGGIITNSEKMYSIFTYCEAISRTMNTVFVSGETGTGKELVAQAVHRASLRKGKFVACNIAGMDDQMISDTLFGHVKGAFTGAVSARKGLVEEAANGTLFLDEIGDMNLTSQVKLLRLLQEKEYTPLGSDISKKAELQIVVATNKDIRTASSEGKFRKDLYYRLMTHFIELPPLSERKNDIQLLLDHFLDFFSQKYDIKRPTYHQSLVITLLNYKYPGNIRELRSMIDDAVINHKSKMLSSDIFKKHIERHTGENNKSSTNLKDYRTCISDLEILPDLKKSAEILVTEALRRADGNQSQAAKLLNITHQAYNKRLKKIEDSN
ncbi:MAG: sigma-54-dependent Fis family transcriptional regulator [bacterium]|nr:sigma-54-dependent Fis family transcriptional regulator [bacterium]